MVWNKIDNLKNRLHYVVNSSGFTSTANAWKFTNVGVTIPAHSICIVYGGCSYGNSPVHEAYISTSPTIGPAGWSGTYNINKGYATHIVMGKTGDYDVTYYLWGHY